MANHQPLRLGFEWRKKGTSLPRLEVESREKLRLGIKVFVIYLVVGEIFLLLLLLRCWLRPLRQTLV